MRLPAPRIAQAPLALIATHSPSNHCVQDQLHSEQSEEGCSL